MKLKAGIIGCGSITRFRHAPEYKANPFISEIVFYDRNPERAEILANQFAGSVAQSLDDLITDPTIDIISDCSSNEFHSINSVKALLGGKHVLCEKPIALTLEDAEQIVQAQRTSNKKLMIDHNQRFTRAHQKARQLIERKELGEVLTFKTSFGHAGPERWGINKSNSTWFFSKERSGLGVAGDLGIHKVDLLHYLLNDQIEQVSAFQGSLDKTGTSGEPIEVCDNLVCSLKTVGGRIGTASFSWTYYGEEDNSTIIYLTGGIIKIYHDNKYPLIVMDKDGAVTKYQLETIQTNDKQTNSGVIDSFVDSVLRNQEPPVTGEDALVSLKVILGIVKAAETASVVQVNQSSGKVETKKV
ncbi:Gfo/Idh/MocA family protein [Sediminibacillus halophilus]|uniref:Predicted dehydrogenase n=1 Tax=Sediminibacillus halophilus TaxID=482461 RepID=A0A1G9TR43_9BACI|nr:Gfo/Idh/MocA family oxidoreductase [Sediminibacillus halophilus]SDM49894.1 Predicted dehydrogenase [Sediminibacillus halophilus]